MPKKSKKSKKPKTTEVSLKLQVEVVPARRKTLRPRKRPNLRTMRNGMGGLTPANLQQPSFFGNTAMLSNSAMSAMNNKAYALERQMLDHQAETRAQANAGRAHNQRSEDQLNLLAYELDRTRALAQNARSFGASSVGAQSYSPTFATRADRQQWWESRTKEERKQWWDSKGGRGNPGEEPTPQVNQYRGESRAAQSAASDTPYQRAVGGAHDEIKAGLDRAVDMLGGRRGSVDGNVIRGLLQGGQGYRQP